jgi:hypothetical protein
MTEPFELIENTAGGLTLRRPGVEDVVDVRLRRAFPWSGPDRYISVRSAEGKELLLVDDLAAVPAPLRALIERTLADTSFIPRITRVDDIDSQFGYQEWSVETDRGPATFRVQEREDIRFLGGGRFRIKDADGNIYELPNAEGLDARSQKELSEIF